MANVLVEETSLSNIASAIRIKNGGSATYKPGEMAAAISNLPIGGSNNGEDAFLTRSGSGDYVNDRIEKLGGGAFYQTNYSTITLSNVKVIDGASVIRYNDNLTTLNLPALTTITCTNTGSNPWGMQISNNSSLTTLNLPNLTTISNSVAASFAYNSNLVNISLPSLTTSSLNSTFEHCSSLETVDLSSLQSSSNAYMTFRGCSSLQSINLPNLTQWGSGDGREEGMFYTFYDCTNLQTVNLPNLTNAGRLDNTFYNCTNLQTVNLPNLTNATLGSDVFESCVSLQTIELKISNVYGGNIFRNCTSLTQVKAPLASIDSSCFSNCSALRKLILPQTDKITTLESSTAFKDTFLDKDGVTNGIYVPSALLNEYRNATNWVTLANHIHALND